MKRTIRNLFHLTPAQVIASYYFLTITISFLLLRLPGVHKQGETLSYIDSLFTAVSAVSVTGLSVTDISTTYTTFGLVLLLFIMQIGGIGIMSIGTFLWILLGKRIGLRERQLIMTDNNQSQLAGVVKLIRNIVTILLLIELIGATILTIFFLPYYDGLSEAMFQGVFASIAATTNSGFAITGSSYLPFADHYGIQIVTMILITLGAIGFPVLMEVKEYFARNQEFFRFSLFTKITVSTFGFLLVGGTAVILLLESFGAFKGVSWHETLFGAMFHSVSSRSGGLTTIDITTFGEPTNLFMSVLMFIGASPSSAGGGIRTTTFAIVILFLIQFARGKNVIQLFGREIETTDVFRAFAVILLAGIMVVISMMVMMVTESGASAIQILFEITSAFGTCGMSLGLTEDLSGIGKFLIMFLMFIGRVGLISFLFTIGGKSHKAKFHYPKERVIIG
ncbi:TrkH family potassium uptake protein [Planomicrobium sp. YIM 101495]|uniref:TrkH family potassium uptake protein n=1 Tax=Planomicrobium sp. YIM 101495 TaxID=2665160 RepID=UPI0012B7A34C|nr:potassium transporter TrkG [Planomicrobium sp. YIM 101495]MTD30419.1 TrkH family potassium uptake protein [Planomicrobium sp. YIM 101495]